MQAGATLGGGTVQSGGNLNIDDGASASGVTVEDGGTQYVASGGSADDTVLTDPGTQIVAAGATVTSTTVDGGFQDDYGTAYATLVESGGSQYVEFGRHRQRHDHRNRRQRDGVQRRHRQRHGDQRRDA